MFRHNRDKDLWSSSTPTPPMTPNNSVLWSESLDFYMMNDSDSDSNHSDINTTIDFDSDKCPDNHAYE